MPAFCWFTAAAICRTAATFSRVMPESARRLPPDDVPSTMPASILFVLASVRETAVPMELVNSWRIPPYVIGGLDRLIGEASDLARHHREATAVLARAHSFDGG